jgi:hypothetical protein
MAGFFRDSAIPNLKAAISEYDCLECEILRLDFARRSSRLDRQPVATAQAFGKCRRGTNSEFAAEPVDLASHRRSFGPRRGATSTRPTTESRMAVEPVWRDQRTPKVDAPSLARRVEFHSTRQ